MKRQQTAQSAKRTAQSVFILSFALFALSYSLPVYSASVITSPVSGARAYPNPWRVDKHANVLVKFDSIPAASIVKIFTVSGREVKQLLADSSGTAPWDRTNDAGEQVASGVYIYLIIDPQGNETSGKLAIIK